MLNCMLGSDSIKHFMKLKSTIIFSLSFLVFISGLFFMHSMSFASASIENASVLIETDYPGNILLPHALGTYNYCPSAIKYNDSIYLFYCANQSSNIIKDHIYLSKITPLSNKKTLFTKKKYF